MASWVLSECGLRPLPRIYARPRLGIASLTPNPSRIGLFQSDPFRVKPIGSRQRNRGNRVSAPLKLQSVWEEEEKEGERVNGVNGGEIRGEFDPGLPPPFKLVDVQAIIPKYCWVKDSWKSMSYAVRDVAVVFGLRERGLGGRGRRERCLF